MKYSNVASTEPSERMHMRQHFYLGFGNFQISAARKFGIDCNKSSQTVASGNAPCAVTWLPCERSTIYPAKKNHGNTSRLTNCPPASNSNWTLEKLGFARLGAPRR